MNSNWSYNLKTLNSGQNCPVWHWNWRITFKTIEHLFYVTSSFVHHFVAINQFKLELQSENPIFGFQVVIFLSHVTLKFDGWPWKTIGHFFYATSRFVQHFVAIDQFKLELQSWNTKKISIFYPVKSLEMSQVTLKYTIVQLSYATLSFVHHLIAIYEFKMELQSGSAKFGSKSAIFLVPCDLIGIGHFKLELQFRNPTFGSKSEMFVPCGLEI